ncbi:hypothetical protein KUL72_14155 [Bradyrhizobium arachidis]|uniref:hypothetical protein n=1 Tax=Bradyrhizobium arachidis TaxID=858423 RepID=UPI002162CDB2|nr:hypothetical protein [Bradyrhizobium arachidis]UVO39408.1 hypothetical protein KUL72_14155 [Bradyrhizobium arachidis]
MHYLDLSLSVQFGLIGLIVVLGAGISMRTVMYFRHEAAGVPSLYPVSWNGSQRRVLERLRLLIGLGLAALWADYVFAIPSVPPAWPLKCLDVIALACMLSASYAWAVLLAARNWRAFEAVPRSFLLIIALLMLWWGTAFSAIGWMLAEASTPVPFRVFPRAPMRLW